MELISKKPDMGVPDSPAHEVNCRLKMSLFDFMKVKSKPVLFGLPEGSLKPIYGGPDTLYDAVRSSWCAETSVDPNWKKTGDYLEWALGQSAATALVISLFTGMTITRLHLARGGVHYHNNCSGGSRLRFDLTHHSFDRVCDQMLGPVVSVKYRVDPEEILADPDIHSRFKILLRAVLDKLGSRRSD